MDFWLKKSGRLPCEALLLPLWKCELEAIGIHHVFYSAQQSERDLTGADTRALFAGVGTSQVAYIFM